MKLWNLVGQINAARHVIDNSRQVGKELLWGYLQGYAFVIALWIIGPLLVTGVLGFSDLLGGPFELFRALFYILLTLIVLCGVALYGLYLKLRKNWQAFKDGVAKQTATEVTDVKSNYRIGNQVE